MSAPDRVMVPAQPPTPPASTMTITNPASVWRLIDRRVFHLGSSWS